MRKRRVALLLVTTAWCGVAVDAPGAAAERRDPVVITYDIRGRGNVSDLEDFAIEAAEVYADPRGWSLGGSLRFDRVDSGGNFTLWLASDGEIPTFGGACDHQWSCRNGRHVAINEDRWLGASESWLEAAGSLAAYRQMVLNHETGHWLGLSHVGCSRPGASAPVMQQQSKTLGGCRPNPWPLVSEQAAVAARRGVPLVQTSAIADPPPSGSVLPPTLSPLETACLRQAQGAVLRPWTRCF